MNLQKSKIFYVDVDGTICSQHNSPTFEEKRNDYMSIEPYPDRIKTINEFNKRRLKTIKYQA